MITNKPDTILGNSERWEAIAQRVPGTEGTFFYAVKTTGIYCRPTCTSRRPKPENVLFFDSWAGAEAAGFRPCKRCSPRSTSPQQQQVAMITQVCEKITTADPPISLAAMAEIAGLSVYHFHRIFKEVVGITPKQYAIAHRTKHVRQYLQEGNQGNNQQDNQPNNQEKTTVTQAIYEAGFETSSNFYDQSASLLGMTPTQYQRGGINVQIQYTVKPCSLGWVLVAATPKGICAIALGDTAESITTQFRAKFPQALLSVGNLEFDTWVTQVLALIQTPQKAVDLPLDIQGTAFQQQVWQALRSIAPGTTQTYAQLAKSIGKPKAVRAVANACGDNPVAVIIPCHRVIGSDGKLRGYHWGLDRKQALLNKEAELI